MEKLAVRDRHRIDQARAATRPTRSIDEARGVADYGIALRSIYRRTVEEEIPDEFLELLDKLR